MEVSMLFLFLHLGLLSLSLLIVEATVPLLLHCRQQAPPFFLSIPFIDFSGYGYILEEETFIGFVRLVSGYRLVNHQV
jgi:hypothetical protein